MQLGEPTTDTSSQAATFGSVAQQQSLEESAASSTVNGHGIKGTWQVAGHKGGACGDCRNLTAQCKSQEQLQSPQQADLICVLQRVQDELDETVIIRRETEAEDDPELIAECKVAEDRLKVGLLIHREGLHRG